tara:strand:+ start:731 stop:1921 length:1191 start_codon:yes stop_codon:yes gene_type:complete
MFTKKIKPSLLIYFLISLSISPSFALGKNNINLLLVLVFAMAPVIILYYRRFDLINKWLFFFVISIFSFPLLFQPESMRWSTIFFSTLFCLTFVAYRVLLNHSYFTPKNYQKVIKYLIYAYSITLLVQQFCVLTGLPIFNVSNYHPSEPWRLNSLSSEPSHSARIVAFLAYCFITITELIQKQKYNFKMNLKKDKWVWLSFFWTMITMGSGTAFLFIGFVLFKFNRLRNFIPLLVIGGALLFLVKNYEITAFDRTYKTVLASVSLDTDKIIEADHSAAVRIVPFIILAKQVNLNTWNGWFGNGIDHVSSFMSNYIRGVPEGFTGGGLFYLWIEYGFIPFILFLIFTLFISYRKRDYLSILFWFMLVFLYGPNSQITWLCVLLLFTNKFFFNRIDKI